MELLLTILRFLLAASIPLAAIILTALTAARLRDAAGAPAAEGEACLHCGKALPGGKGQFHFTEPIGNARERAAKKQFSAEANPILGSETHFICDSCARRYLRNEMLQHLLFVLPYPVYLYALLPIFSPTGFFASFGIEILLIILSIAGLIAALDLYRAVRFASTPLDEARDRVAIGERRNYLGKSLSYYSRRGIKNLYQ